MHLPHGTDIDARAPAHAERPLDTEADAETHLAIALARFRTFARVALHMMWHDKAKSLGTLAGVVFAVVLSTQQIGVFFGLVDKSVMLVAQADADLWIAPKNTETLLSGKRLSDSSVYLAKEAPGVAWAAPLVYGTATVSLPGGGVDAVTLVGTEWPAWHGGPWNLVSGSADALARPDTMIFEDSEREKLGGLNLGSVREVNGRNVTVGGFTWGLLPFGPSYAFAEIDSARRLLHLGDDETSFVLVGLSPGADAAAVRAELQARMPEARVLTRAEFRRSIVTYTIGRTAIGATVGMSALVGLLVGFVVVALSMFSAVLENLREFGTLRALGATDRDLSRLLFVQSIAYAVVGSAIGFALVGRLTDAIRSPRLAVMLPGGLVATTLVVVVLMCLCASLLSVARVRRLEPAMVFR